MHPHFRKGSIYNIVGYGETKTLINGSAKPLVAIVVGMRGIHFWEGGVIILIYAPPWLYKWCVQDGDMAGYWGIGN
jgi:hypothetical protein